MLHPSYSELIEAINTNNEDDDESMVLNSRYSLILATSKRARQLIGGAKPLADNVKGKKPLSIAIDELYHGKVKILPGQHEEEDLREIAGLAPEQPAEEAAAEEAVDAAVELLEPPHAVRAAAAAAAPATARKLRREIFFISKSSLNLPNSTACTGPGCCSFTVHTLANFFNRNKGFQKMSCFLKKCQNFFCEKRQALCFSFVHLRLIDGYIPVFNRKVKCWMPSPFGSRAHSTLPVLYSVFRFLCPSFPGFAVRLMPAGCGR